MRISLWCIGLPATLAVLGMLLWQQSAYPVTYQRVQNVQRWIEPLPATAAYNLAGFRDMVNAMPRPAAAVWTATNLPDWSEQPAFASNDPVEKLARAWFRFTYTVPADAAPSDLMAIYGTRIMGGAYSVWADGQLLDVKLDDWRMLWNHPVFVSLPPHLIRPGKQVEIVLAIPYRVSQGYALGSLYAGKSYELLPKRNLREFFQHSLPVMGIILVAIMGALSFVMWLRRRIEREHLWLALLSVSLVVANLQFTHEISTNDALSKWYGFIVDAATAWVFLCYAAFVFRFNKLSYPKVELVHIIFTTVTTLATMPIWDWPLTGMRLQHYASAAVFLYISVLLTYLACKHREISYWMLSAALWFLFATGFHDITLMSSQVAPDGIWLFPYGAFVLFIVAEFLMQRRYIMALSVIEQNNALLSQKLAEREQALLVKQRELLETQKKQTLLLERERLVQDIHDGIGASLMHTLAGLNNGTATASDAAAALAASLDDLRIVIESLEPNQHDLPSLLGALRHRFGNRLQAAGLNIVWRMDDLPALPWLDAPHALDLLRVVQEIVTNVLKHASASDLLVSATEQPDEGVLLILEDNGRGFDSTAVRAGRGLKHLRSRLARIGARLSLDAQTGKGVRYSILLPFQREVGGASKPE